MKIKNMITIPLGSEKTGKHFRLNRDYCLPRIHSLSKAMIYNNFIYHPELLHAYKLNYDFYFNRSSICTKHRQSIQSIKGNEGEIVRLKGSYFYVLHPYSYNYSHFTLNCIASLLFFNKYFGFSNKLQILTDYSLPFQQNVLKFNKLSVAHPILKQDVLYIVDHIILTSISFNPSYNNSVIDLFTHYLIQRPNLRPKLYLYISRGRNNIRKIKNEREVERYLSKYGFLCVDFAKISVEEQVHLLNKSIFVIAPHGASGANFVYFDESTRKIIEFFKEDWTYPCHTKILLEKNCLYSGFINKISLEDADGSFDVSFNKLDWAMSSKGIQLKNVPEDLPAATSDITEMLKRYRIIADAEKSHMFAKFEKTSRYIEGIKYLVENYNFKFLKEIVLFCFMAAEYDTLEHFLYEKNIVKESPQVFYDALIRLGVYGSFDFDLVNLVSELKKIDYYKALEWQTFISLISVNSNTIASWHNGLLSANIKSKKLLQIYSGVSSIKLGLVENNYRLIVSPNNIPIISLDKFGNFSFSENLMKYKIIKNGKNCISIQIGDKYLSAQPNATFALADHNREFEHFYDLSKPSLLEN